MLSWSAFTSGLHPLAVSATCYPIHTLRLPAFCTGSCMEAALKLHLHAGGSFDAYSQSSSRAPSLNSMQRQQLSAALNSSPEQQRLSSSYPPGVAGVPLGGSDPNYAQLLREHQLRCGFLFRQQSQPVCDIVLVCSI